MNFIHRDIKLENILVGREDSDQIFLIDFGLSIKYIDEASGKHVPKEMQGKFVGNLMFASLQTIRGKTPSRRDDVESAMYLLIFLLNNQKLPWSILFKKHPGRSRTFSSYINERLKTKYMIEFFKMVLFDLRHCIE